MLKVISQFLREQIRLSDLVARYGGEEFGIILPETNLEGAITLIERLREGLYGLPIQYDGQKLSNITLSFGIASCSSGETISKKDFMQKADDTLYRAKRNGRNEFCFFGSNDN